MTQKVHPKWPLKIADKFKQPRNVYISVLPLYYTSFIFGLAPYSFKNTFTSSTLHIIRSVLQFAVFLCAVAWNVYMNKTPFSEGDLSVKLEYFEDICSVSLCAIEMFCASIFAKKMIRMFRDVEEIDKQLQVLSSKLPYRRTFIEITLSIGTCIMLVVLLFAFDAFYAPTSENIVDEVWMTAIKNVPFLLAVLMVMQYFHYMNLIRWRFKTLNRYLRNFNYDRTPVSAWTTFGNVTKTPTDETKQPKDSTILLDPLHILDEVAAIHIKLSDAAQQISFMFSFQLLLRITVAFVSIVIALFLIAISFSKAGAVQDYEMEINITFTIWAFFNAFNVVMVVWVTSSTCEEANKCPRLLHKIRNNTRSSKLQDAIEIYSLQMHHNKLGFTVCGLFPLDFTLLYTIVAGVTTYLVILIQFSNSEFLINSDDTNTTNRSTGKI